MTLDDDLRAALGGPHPTGDGDFADVTRRAAGIRRRHAVVRTAVLGGVAIAIVGGGVLLAGRDDEQGVVATEPDVTTTSTTMAPPERRTSTIAVPTTSAVLSATSTTTPDPATSEPTLRLVLEGDGLGALTFGLDLDEVVAALTTLLGDPLLDSGEFATPEPCGDVTTMRRIEWDGLAVVGQGRSGDLEFVEWQASIGAIELRTEVGPAIGEPIERWQAVYGDAFQVHEEPSTVDGAAPAHRVTVEVSDGLLVGGPTSGAVVDFLRTSTGVCSTGD